MRIKKAAVRPQSQAPPAIPETTPADCSDLVPRRPYAKSSVVGRSRVQASPAARVLCAPGRPRACAPPAACDVKHRQTFPNTSAAGYSELDGEQATTD
ncbi:hypothetical protein ZWY2020_002046 [Hordeum vulgare]|nr:hypothetical protein ZWY2020_002046 [Hordeum vulgare]